jgi:hypothetical protein
MATWLTRDGWTLLPENIGFSGDPEAPTRQIWRKRFAAGLVELNGPECAGKNNLFVLAVPVVDPPQITGIKLAERNVRVTWTGGGTLHSSPSLTPASWTDTGDSDGSYTAPLGPVPLCFRVRK